MAFAIGTIYMKTLTKEELAKTLDLMGEREHRIKSNARIAADNNLVIICGASDDLLEFDGAIYDEVGAWGGAKAYIKDGNLLTLCDSALDDSRCEVHCPTYEDLEEKADAVVNAAWGTDEFPWYIEANVPYAPFTMYDGDGPFCRGIVIDLDEL